MTKQVLAEEAINSLYPAASKMNEPKLYSSSECNISQIELSLSCCNLADRDTFSKSDPMIVVYIQEPISTGYKELGRTEVIWNNLNPVFVRKFILDYNFGNISRFKFEVYDVDSKTHPNDLFRHDFLGEAYCVLDEICKSKKLEKTLQSRKKGDKVSGKLIIIGDEIQVSKEKLSIQFCAKDLDRKDVVGTSDPFLRIYKSNEDNSETLVHKTEVVKNNLNPQWKSFEISVRALCNNDYLRPIRIECLDYNINGKHKLIGYFTASLEQLKSGAKFECEKPNKEGKKHSGDITVLTATIERVYTFLDYIKEGTNINNLIAVDFTESNGKPGDPKSLHYANPNSPNAYVQALRGVGEVIELYDSDGMFPAWGFGARLPPDGAISHCFPLNEHISNPYCIKIDGVLEAYYQTLDRVRLSGPTLFAPCINEAARLARTHADGSEYFILLILTDGMFCDIDNTSKAIVAASSLPLSIIIIGIGDADFEGMKILDGDKQRFSFQGKEAEGDIVQFFKFDEFEKVKNVRSIDEYKMILAAEVLAEVPGQFLSYMEINKVRPGQF